MTSFSFYHEGVCLRADNGKRTLDLAHPDV